MDDEDDEAGSAEDAPSATVSKRRKVGTSQSRVIEEKSVSVTVPKAKKEKPKPTEYKRGVWNPDVELIMEETHKTSSDSKIDSSCCQLCNNKNVIRAVKTGNKALLKKCIYDKDNISNLCAPWSAEVQETALDYVICNGEHELLQMLVAPDVETKTGRFKNDVEGARRELVTGRKTAPTYLLSIITQGRVSNMAYGGHIR